MSKFIVVFFVLLFFATQSVFAMASVFTVRMQVGIDTTPPSTPATLTATPVAQTQVNLSWGVSVDNFELSGYQVFRDGNQIATTTLSSYSDSGLTANTLYSYYIKAFDNSLNISSSSVVVATTTLPNIATTTEIASVSTNGSMARPSLISFLIEPDMYSVTMTWQSSKYAQFEIRWGRTTSYELGFISNELYKERDITTIDGLEAGTVYEFELVAYDRLGKRMVLKNGTFKTDDAQDIKAPMNVSNLKATVINNTVALSWVNPTDVDFSHVRVVRNHLFFPTDAVDGFIAYDGVGTNFYDTNAFSNEDVQYYSIFSYDAVGNISSGAVVRVQINAVTQGDDTGGDISGPKDSSASTTLSVLYFSDIEIVQEGIVLGGKNIDIDKPLLLRIEYGKLPEHLKTITVTFTHPHDQQATFSFLLRINKDKTYYEAYLAPLRIEGRYPVMAAIFDHLTQKIFSVAGSVTAEKKYYVQLPLTQNGENKSVFSTVVLFAKGVGLFVLCVIPIWLLLFFRIIRRVR